jgi:hypothetical protein
VPDRPDPFREENERREKQTASLIARFEEAGEHINAAANALTQHLPLEMSATDSARELVKAAQSLRDTLWHVLDIVKHERGPGPVGPRMFPGLDAYLQQHPQKEPES